MLAVARPGPAFYAVCVETLTFLFTDIEGSTALLRRLVRGSLPPGTALRDLGVHRLKDLGRPEQIFQLSVTGLPAEFPPLRSLGNPAGPPWRRCSTPLLPRTS